jgi:hypothetical protein
MQRWYRGFEQRCNDSVLPKAPLTFCNGVLTHKGNICIPNGLVRDNHVVAGGHSCKM